MQINLAYLHGENNNEDKVDEVNKKIRNILSSNEFITVKDNNTFLKIPYGNDGEYVIPIFSELLEYEKGLEYFRLNDMAENKLPFIMDINSFNEFKDDSNCLGLLINIATSSYIIPLVSIY